MTYISSEVFLAKVKGFAIGAHGNQKRKYTHEPYWTHLQSVSAILQKHSNPTVPMIASCWLHDIVEDTSFSALDLQDLFGDQIASYVSFLTEPDKEFGNRETRKKFYNEQLASAPPEVQTIKYCDLIDNTSSITKHDPDFAKVYLAEKRILLPMINKGHPGLYKMACELAGFKDE